MSRKLLMIFVICFMFCLTARTEAQTIVASEDFDGGAVNLIDGFNPATQNITGSVAGGNAFLRFGVYGLDEFTVAEPGPFNLCDDSASDVSTQGANPPFPGDTEGTVGENRGTDDRFFIVSSASDFTIPSLADRSGSWTFDISSAKGPFQLKIDMGQCSNDSFDGVPGGNSVLIQYSIDGGLQQTAFELTPAELVGTGFSYRLFDNGNVSEIDFGMNGTHLGLEASNAGVTKTLADTGVVAGDTILNKTPPSGPGAGLMDTFSIDLLGSGNSIEITMTAVDFSFEAFAFDNIRICTESKDCVLGDVNQDGVVTLLDVDPFIALLTDGAFQCEADVNEDGIVSLLDVNPFVELLSGG